MENNHNSSPLSSFSQNKDNQFSVFGAPVTTKIPFKESTLKEVWQEVKFGFHEKEINRIRSNSDPGTRKQLKNEILSSFTVSGTFETRSAKGLIAYSGIIVIDFDDIDTKIKETLIHDTVLNFALIFISPSANGLKVFVRVNNAKVEDHGIYFKSVSNYIFDKYQIKADPSGKDISRLCYFSYDQDAYYSGTGHVEASTLIAQLNPASQCKIHEAKNNKVSEIPRDFRRPSDELSKIQSVVDRSVDLLKRAGGQTLDNVHWTRPGKELSSGPSAKFNEDPKDGIKKFTVFSSNWIPFEVKGYTSVQIICLLEFDNNWNRCISALTKEYSQETRLTSIPQRPLQSAISQVSPSGVIERSIKVVKISDSEYAVWFFSFNLIKDKKTGQIFTELCRINRYQLIKQIASIGILKRFYSARDFEYIQQKQNIIAAKEIVHIKDVINILIHRVGSINIVHEGLQFKASLELMMKIFLDNCPSFFCNTVLGFLPNHNKPILKDTKTVMYFPFENSIAKVTTDCISFVDYKDLKDECIWDDHRLKRTFEIDENSSQFSQFITNVMNGEEDRIAAIRSAIGYILHNFSDPVTNQAVIFLDEELTNKYTPQGGSGKGIVLQAIKELRKLDIIDGRMLQDNNRFAYQNINQTTQVSVFDDVRPDFKLSSIFPKITGSWQVEHKNKPLITLETNPKIIVTSNTVISGEGKSYDRRKFEVEFGNFYSKQIEGNIEPIIITHGCMFFSDQWDCKEWNRFYTYMLHCAEFYLKDGLQYYEYRSINENKIMQSTSNDFAKWIKLQNFEIGKEYDVHSLFEDFITTCFGEESGIGQRTFTGYLKQYALTYRLEMIPKRSNGKTYIRFSNKSA